ncbi:hypothetical protein [Pseudomonas sp. NY8896]|uniref:hypothetical protein n=2 Tax=unclassified Pseudomonas TaxID=196821 RepID=UPI0031F67B99
MKDVFSSFELEVINAIISITRDGTKAIIMREKVYNRLAKLNRGIASNRRIYTFKNHPLEVQEFGHPFEIKFKISQIGTTCDLRSELRDNNEGYNILILDVSAFISKEYNAYKKLCEFGYPVISMRKLFVKQSSEYLKETQKLMDTNAIGLTLSYITDLYFTGLAANSRIKAENIANDYAGSAYTNKLYLMAYHIFSYAYQNEDLNFLFGIFLDIGTMNNSQFYKLISDKYTSIPYLGTNPSTISTVTLQKEIDENIIEYEIFIKREGQVAHLIYQDDFDPNGIIMCNLYDTSKKDSLIIRGNEFCIDDDFMENQHLELLLMVLSDCENVKVRTDIRYDYQKSMKWVMNNTCPSEPINETKIQLHEYLQQRGE